MDAQAKAPATREAPQENRILLAMNGNRRALLTFAKRDRTIRESKICLVDFAK
jgi:hypothetical protein